MKTSWPPAKTQPLPRQARPIQNETVCSFIQRLAQANHIRDTELAGHLNPELAGKTSRHQVKVSLSALAVASGIDALHLAHALPETRPQLAKQRSLRAHGRGTRDRFDRKQLACRRCTAVKNVTSEVTVWARSDQNVCLRHQLWIGQGVRSLVDQADVADVRDIGQAQIRHHNLTRRHGHLPVRHAYRTADEVIDYSSLNDTQAARWERKRHFLDRDPAKSPPWSYDYAAYYPEVVAVLSVLTSPHWRRMATSDNPAPEEQFYRQVANNGLAHPTAAAQNTPLLKWITRQRELSDRL